MKVPLEVPHDWGMTCFATEMHLLEPFFIKRRSPFDPESSRMLIDLFLTFSPELTLGSCFLVQSEHVILLFSFKLVLFSPNFFNLDANFFGNQPFPVFWERFFALWEFPYGQLALSVFWQEGFSFLDLALRKLHLFLLKMLIIMTTIVNFPSFCSFDSNFISPRSLTRVCSGNFKQVDLSR